MTLDKLKVRASGTITAVGGDGIMAAAAAAETVPAAAGVRRTVPVVKSAGNTDRSVSPAPSAKGVDFPRLLQEKAVSAAADEFSAFPLHQIDCLIHRNRRRVYHPAPVYSADSVFFPAADAGSGA